MKTKFEAGIFFSKERYYFDRINHEKLAEEIKIHGEALDAKGYDIIAIIPVTVSGKSSDGLVRDDDSIFSDTESVIITARKRA